MVIKIYTTELSPQVRAVNMACDIFNVTYENVEINLMDKDLAIDPAFLIKNPLHTVPVFEDGDFILHDSHAILIYLADAYGKDETWYPKDDKLRALVNQKLFFDNAVLFPRLKNVMYALVIDRKQTIKQKWMESIQDGYGFMEQFLSRTTYIANDNITIAELSVYSNISSLAQIVPIDKIKYSKTCSWCNVMKKKPYCIKHNNPGAATLGDLMKQCRESTSK